MTNKLKPIHGNLLLLVGAILLVTIGMYVQQRDLLTGILITELFLIMTPSLLFALYLKVYIKKEFRFNGFSFKEFVLVTIIMLTFYPMAVFSNFLVTIGISQLGELPASPIDMPQSLSSLLVYIIVIAGSAGLCEEIMFRGFIMRSYESLGKGKALIISSILFGFIHFNIQNLAGPIFLGFIIGYIVLRTNSLWIGIYAHMLNNAFALTLGFFLSDFVANQGDGEPVTLGIMLLAGVFLLFIASFFGVFGLMALHKLKKITKAKVEEEEANILEADTLEPQMNPLHWLPVLIFALIFVYVGFRQIQLIIGTTF